MIKTKSAQAAKKWGFVLVETVQMLVQEAEDMSNGRQ
uniref:Uncharacterized protein n=1 Tax=Rhizophora mucronata TaxID=61149 RepID=A0A2P2PMK1_RHIMU